MIIGTRKLLAKVKIDGLSVGESITALFITTRSLKLKNQLTFAFFPAIDHLNGPLRKQNFA